MSEPTPEFTEALAVVLRDLRAQCAVQPDIRDNEDGPGVILFAPDGSGQGVHAEPDGRGPATLLAEVADQVQGWAVEALWAAGASAVWPGCPEHPDTHPLGVEVVEGAAVWVCPRTGAVVCRVGEL
ncbi:hypothetical protein Sipo8835_36755 [Streptomyces ipomoeae]|jgi:hypothetical protein|uniref:Uncharacterized protein n=5 Tax=Streptomyces ipomoeae TaxID=103232 RepID=L1KLX1_9ACTN|nr:hypothetical protein [Streptomyces ipomoeae]EKX61368.1 hypothetical protein STRIP9103_04907 [Streptomyces ipomoeae 91-03]TQE21952.1 hypothetical protein Sipo8835_36755 [Streptomyces ipomoeae]TQE34927.1 hypothetical protein Sipo7851_16465 [Streptomyces ipomoeae]